MGIQAPATKRGWWRRVGFACTRAVRSVLLLTDTPHRIAIGSAAGLFVMPLPIPGQVVIGPLLARALGGNLVASIPWTWVNNPFTFLIFNYVQYRIGCVFVPGTGEPLSFAGLADLVDRFRRLPWSEAADQGLDVLGAILVPLVIGSFLVAAFAAVLGYVTLHAVVVQVQARKKARHAVWQRGGSTGAGGVDADTGR